MLRKIQEYISRHDLMGRDGFYVVALSGGADSVALLLSLHQLGYHIEAAHCNFRLRGSESDRDEQFCVDLCNRLGITLHRIHFDTHTYAELHRESIETAARNLRYGYFEQLRRDIGADAICVAHHRDDQVETVLLHLLRGAGVRGLAGMQPRRDNILRPLLGLWREEIVAWLKSENQDFVVDSTNLEEDEAMRNKLRLKIIPMLEEINQGARGNIVRAAENLSDANKLLEASLDNIGQKIIGADGAIDLDCVRRQPAPLYVLWSLVENRGFTRVQMEEMLASDHSGRRWETKTHIAFCDQGRLTIVSREDLANQPSPLRMPEEGNYIYHGRLVNTSPEQSRNRSEEQKKEQRVKITRCPIDCFYKIDPSPWVAQFDSQKAKFPLTLRPVKEGDRFMPLGMHGTKLVSDYLADRKVPSVQRLGQMVLTDAAGQILWLVGHRIDQRAAICPGKTTEMIKIEI